MKISVYRKDRAARVHWEHHRGHYIMFGIASPTHHRWWAFTVFIYY